MKLVKSKKIVVTLLPLLFAVNLAGCATTSDKKDDDDAKSSSNSDSKDDGGSSVSSERQTLTNSWSNNPLTSQTISIQKAERQVEQLPLNSKDKRNLEGRLSAERLSRKSTGAALATAKRIAEMEMDRGAERDLQDEVKLDLALAAINNKNFALAEYYFSDLNESKNPRVKAGVFNAIGVIALRDGRVPEAVASFKEALKIQSNYKPALLNLGFAALKGGDIETAKRSLGGMQDDWFVQYGQISVARLEGQEGKVDELCDRVLKKEPGHKAALFNCGLHEFQSKRNFAKARDMLEKSAKAKGGETNWEEKAYRLITQIGVEESNAKQEAAKKKAEEAARAKAASPAAPATGGK